MRKLTRNFPIFIFILAVFLVFNFLLGANSNPDRDINVLKIRKAIEKKGYNWVAGETSMSILPIQERRMRLGTRVPQFDQPLRTIRFQLPQATPPNFDWRHEGGQNFVTSIKDQGDCGSCWAFAVVAAIEAMNNIERFITSQSPRTPGFNYGLDLSEQFLVSCSGAGDCAEGGWPEVAAEYVRTDGIAREDSFPYAEADLPCGPDLDWSDRAIVIENWSWVTQSTENRDAIYNALQNGPLAAYMDVYSDFYYYHSGIYQYTTGDLEGGHMILIVGYDKSGNYWICKNSWGTRWGENGYFKMKMGKENCEIGTWIISVWGVGLPSIYPPTNITGFKGENKSLLQSEIINEISWEANPRNAGFNVIKYKIFLEIDGQWTFLDEVSASTTKYWHEVDDLYVQQTYAIVGILDDNRESIAGYVTIK